MVEESFRRSRAANDSQLGTYILSDCAFHERRFPLKHPSDSLVVGHKTGEKGKQHMLKQAYVQPRTHACGHSIPDD